MTKKTVIRQSAIWGALLTSMGAANAQVGWFICGDFGAMCSNSPLSNDYGNISLGEPLDDSPFWTVVMGTSGSFSVWGNPGCASCPVIFPAFSAQSAGRIGFGIGSQGTIQTNLDDNMMLTFGMPFPAGSWSYATINNGGNRALWGSTGFNILFKGESDRYFIAETGINGTTTRLRTDIVGDAARLHWTITPTTNNAQVGLWFGQWIALITGDGSDYRGYVGTPDKYPYISMPGITPPLTERRYIRNQNSEAFPQVVNMAWSQDQPVGLQVLNGPTSASTDPLTATSDATQADEFVIGQQGALVSGVRGLLGGENVNNPTFTDSTFALPGENVSDVGFLDNPAYIQKFYNQGTANGQPRHIVQYFKSVWSEANYVPPYATVIDAPKVIAYDPSGTNSLSPNPATVRITVDNTQRFATIQKDLFLSNVRITLDLRQSPGFTFVGGGQTQTRVIPRIDARRMQGVDFQIQHDGLASGTIPYTVTVEATPGPKRTLKGSILVATTPRLELRPGANLVTAPWEFSDSSWSAILGLNQPTEFQAFVWDPIQNGYVLTTTAERGRPTWIVVNQDYGLRQLNANPQLPDMVDGGIQIQLRRGWNLISNPYPYPIYLGQIVGSSNSAAPQEWPNLVEGGFVNGAVAYWDNETQSYKFVSGIFGRLEPNRGYWLFARNDNITLRYPGVYQEGVPTGRAVNDSWQQSEKQWRLMLSARTNRAIDDQNFIGTAPSTRDVQRLEAYEPPKAPGQKVALSIAPATADGSRLAQALVPNLSRHEWRVLVETTDEEAVTITWPNMSTVPRGVRFRITDVATGTSRDMRQTSGYTFTPQGAGTREFKVTAELGGSTRPVIGDVQVQRGRGPAATAPLTLTYNLSSSAVTSVRILGPSGKEIRSITRGRADAAGANTVTWDLRDAAGRSVAPGTYRAEIVAEVDGQRVRRMVPLNVIR